MATGVNNKSLSRSLSHASIGPVASCVPLDQGRLGARRPRRFQRDFFGFSFFFSLVLLVCAAVLCLGFPLPLENDITPTAAVQNASYTMGFTLQILLGLTLALLAACLQTPDIRFGRQVSQIQVGAQGNATKNVTEIDNRDVNKIEKTETGKHVESFHLENTTQENVIEKQKDEASSSGRGRSIETGNTSKNSSGDANKIRKTDETSKSSSKENATEGDEKNTVKKQTDSSEDKFDINEFITDDFHNKKNTFTFSPDHNEDFYGHVFDDFQATTKFEMHHDLTTPKSPIFDQKYKETMEGVNQNLENTNFDDVSEEELELDEPASMFDPKKNNTKLHFKQVTQVLNNNTNDNKHKNIDVEQVKVVQFENYFNETNVYDTTEKLPGSYESSSEEIIPTTIKNVQPTPTTRKSTVAFTKPSNNKNNSDLLDNKIEKENIKATTPVTTLTTEKFGKLVETTTRPSKEQAVQENQVVTIAVTLPRTTTERLTTTTTEKLTTTTTTTSTTTTAKIEDISTTIPTSTTEDINETTLKIEELSTSEATETSTTPIFEITTEELKTTTEIIEQTSTTEQPQTTTEFQTTESIVRTSKFMNIQTEQTTETTTTSDIQADQTTSPKMTTTEAQTTTEETTTVLPTTEAAITTEAKIEATTTEVPAATTTEFAFVHINTVGVNHTTLEPETLKPSYEYPIPEVPKQENLTTTEEETTTEDVTSSYPPTEGGLKNNNDGNKGTIAAIAISSVGAACLVILAGLLFIMRKRQKRFNYVQRCRPVTLDSFSMDNVSLGGGRKSQRMPKTYGNPAFDDPGVSHPLSFPALAKFASNSEEVKKEFDQIPQIVARTSELPEGCDEKNRYANVIPLPETRVYLAPIENYPNSDYINANYVTGPKDTKGYYIATQGPLPETVDDFWRMVWEQQSKVILMITHLFENGMEQCVDYLPPSEVSDCHRLFGDFQVTLKKREAKEKYIISSLRLKNMVSNSWREVTHFWYLGWPEKGVPSETNSLIAFLIEARSYMKSSSLDKASSNQARQEMSNGATHNEINPVVVHCSPGTGRTGVVIACDIAIREFEQNRLVDIQKIVYKIRRDRARAVQTKEHYQFIYKVVSQYATKLTGGALESI